MGTVLYVVPSLMGRRWSVSRLCLVPLYSSKGCDEGGSFTIMYLFSVPFTLFEFILWYRRVLYYIKLYIHKKKTLKGPSLLFCEPKAAQLCQCVMYLLIQIGVCKNIS